MTQPTIKALSERIAQTPPDDRSSRAQVLQDLKALRQRVSPQTSKDRLNRLDAAVLLMEFMNSIEEAVSTEAMGVVARLVATLDGGSADEPMPEYPSPPEENSELQLLEGDLEVTHSVLVGQILLESGIVTIDDIGEALRLQLSTRRPMGACLVQMGAATEGQVHHALQMQEELRGDTGEPGSSGVAQASESEAQEAEESISKTQLPPLRLTAPGRHYMRSLVDYLLGEIMIRLGSISRKQLDHAMSMQRASGKFLGETLVETGAASWDQVQAALGLQRRYR